MLKILVWQWKTAYTWKNKSILKYLEKLKHDKLNFEYLLPSIL